MEELSVFDRTFWLVVLAVASFFQNITFSLSSRSRNSGDIWHHWRMAILSNGVWFCTHILVFKQVWEAFTTGAFLWIAVTAVVYTIATSLGGTYGMHLSMKRESGDRRVGANKWTRLKT